jgi:TM2 domain-containing membrane protein YozV
MAMIYCYECGKKISENAKTCPYCGAPNKKFISTKKKIWVALLLAWFLGIFGAHRFYVGKTGSAIVMLILTCTVFGIAITAIWAFVDLIIIACEGFADKTGTKLKYN